MGRMTKEEEQAQAIIQLFYQKACQEGFENVSLPELALNLGISLAELQAQFSDRDALMVATVDFLLTQYEQTYMAEMDKVKDPDERLDLVLNIVFGIDWLEVTEPSVFYACYYLSYRNKQVKKRFHAMYEWFRELLVNEIHSWMEAGLISTTEPEQVADFIIMLNEGITYYEGVMNDPDAYRKRGEYLKAMVRNMLENIEVKLYI